MEGANPCRKDAGDLREPTKTLQKIMPWRQKSKSSRKLRSTWDRFLPTSDVPTSQSWGSNPDRSPVAQWLNMRISPASCLAASRGPLKTRDRPGVGGKPRAAGKVCRNHGTGANSPTFKTLPGPALAASPVQRGRFNQKSQHVLPADKFGVGNPTFTIFF